MRLALSIAGPALCALVLLAACGRADVPQAAQNNAAASPGNEAAPSPAPTVKPAAESAIAFKEGKVEFRYAWPAEAAAIPELDAWLRGNGEALQAKMMAGARQEEAAAKKNGYDMPGYSYIEQWGVVADLPALLVMQSEGYNYTGGAHGMPIVTTMFWDKAAKKRLPSGALIDIQALNAAAKDRFCAALDAEREKRRGAPVNREDKNELVDFVSCVDMTKQTILPVSKGGKALDTMRIVIMPYEAGPYAEGIYQIDLPVDAAILKAVKPAYRGSFSADG